MVSLCVVPGWRPVIALAEAGLADPLHLFRFDKLPRLRARQSSNPSSLKCANNRNKSLGLIWRWSALNRMCSAIANLAKFSQELYLVVRHEAPRFELS
ncbi:hypothetical protein DO72_4477 [Burkholderia pseudomallei]|nr:hypothetical protein DO66_6098 [Burkholderia pseudomallei]KGD13947.1 hypothetical protein DP42_1380 [Burkholderia pseudomallei]KGD40253.1 hypothetical protein DO72_4477 [Burkholderia pseudomallei]KGW68203.1 hypothetical protein Y042_5888 [Burkholderia pseudomallei MSHR1357]